MLSFYETGVLARRATRGAGYDWGLAEEATFAAGWLCDYGVDGADVLSRYYRRVDGQKVASRMVRAWPDSWAGEAFGNSPLCPLCLGAALSDFGLPSGVEKVVISKVYAPVLLLPFIANLPAEDGKIWTIEGDITDDINPVRVVIIRAVATGLSAKGSDAKKPRYPQKEDAFLLELAQRTYVPESEASRAKGAG